MTKLNCARAAALFLVLSCATAPRTFGGQLPPSANQQNDGEGKPADSTPKSKRGDVLADTPDIYTQVEQVEHALLRLPLAAGLAAVLALRPRRRGTPPRQAPVIQTQIILAIVGAVVMLVVGSSLARAFGIVGAAGLVRYRSKIEDPKDAGVMLSTLAIGLASGVGLWLLALLAMVFVLAVLWVIESFEKATHLFALRVRVGDPTTMRPELERLLQRNRLKYELRTVSPEEIMYDVQMPVSRTTDRVSEQILDLDRDSVAVQWEEKKEKK